MAFTLRPYQLRALEEDAKLRASGARVVALVSPTGSGKTAMAVEWARRRGGRGVFVAHRDELLDQARKTLARAHVNAEVVSIQSQLGGLPKGDWFALDEAHHYISAPKWSEAIAVSRAGPTIALTATPERSDGAALGNLADGIVTVAQPRELIADGFLTPCDVLAGERQTKHLTDHPWDSYRKHANGRKTIVFCPNVAYALECAQEFRERGIAAGCVHGELHWRERKKALEDHAEGRIRVLTSVNVLCLDEATEILTSSGWVGIDEMTVDHHVANWDNGAVTFEKPLELVRRARLEDERMAVVDGHVSVRVTETHRMLYRTLRKGKFLKTAARDLEGKSVQIPVCGNASPLQLEPAQRVFKTSPAASVRSQTYTIMKREGLPRHVAAAEAVARVSAARSHRHKSPSELTLPECALIGFWLGDGTRTKLIRGGVEYVVSQSKVYPRIIEWFDKIVAACGVDVIRRERPWVVPHVRWSMPRGTGGSVQRRSGLFPLEPYLNKNGTNLFFGLNDAQFDAMIDGLWLADGNHLQGIRNRKRARQIHSANWQFLSSIQAVACVRGYSANIRKESPPRKHNHAQLYKLCIRKTDNVTLSKGRVQLETTYIPERVWCVKTRTKNILTRRNGTIVVMGNTEGYDDPTVTCAIMARRFGSAGGWIQACGRIVRTSPGKTRALVIDLHGSVWAWGLPDADRHYSLDGEAIHIGEDTGAATRQCKTCFRIFPSSSFLNGQCPACGSSEERETSPIVVVEEIARVTFEQLNTEQLEWLSKARHYATQHNYKPGWVSWKFRDKFGCWPPGDLGKSPEEVRAEPESERRAFYAKMVAIGQAKGYKPGFAKMRFRGRYGAWPPTGW